MNGVIDFLRSYSASGNNANSARAPQLPNDTHIERSMNDMTLEEEWEIVTAAEILAGDGANGNDVANFDVMPAAAATQLPSTQHEDARFALADHGDQSTGLDVEGQENLMDDQSEEDATVQLHYEPLQLGRRSYKDMLLQASPMQYSWENGTGNRSRYQQQTAFRRPVYKVVEVSRQRVDREYGEPICDPYAMDEDDDGMWDLVHEYIDRKMTTAAARSRGLLRLTPAQSQRKAARIAAKTTK